LKTPAKAATVAQALPRWRFEGGDSPEVKLMKRSRELQAALDAAEQAAIIARSLYQGNFEVRIKADNSPVTEADVRCEIAIREILEARFPSYGFLGEETGARAENAESLWVVDPIDGTKAFVRGYSMFSTQIGLMRAGELVLGVSSAPVYGELACAERGCGAHLNGQAVAVSRVSALESAGLSAGNLKSLATGSRWPRYGELVARVSRSRGYGDFLHYHLLAAGKIDAVIETDINILDIAACAAIVTEAGGRFTDLSGAPITLRTNSVLATNGLLHADVLAALDYGGD
jgi:histidinol-phosphatase